MAGFWGLRFIYDGKPSDMFSLYMSSTSGGEIDTTGSSSIDIKDEKILRNPVPYVYGFELTPVLTFDVSVNTVGKDYLTAIDARTVQKWLFGVSSFRKLQIVQDDLNGVYFNAVFTDPQVYKVGNTVRGFKSKIVCDAPYAWAFSRTLTKTYTGIANETFNFLNESDDDMTYLWPDMTVTMSSFGGDFTITNNGEARSMTFEDLQSGEVLTINNRLKILQSSTGLKRIANFNKNWFRFIPNLNNITIQGNVQSVSFTYSFPRKVG